MTSNKRKLSESKENSKAKRRKIIDESKSLCIQHIDEIHPECLSCKVADFKNKNIKSSSIVKVYGRDMTLKTFGKLLEEIGKNRDIDDDNKSWRAEFDRLAPLEIKSNDEFVRYLQMEDPKWSFIAEKLLFITLTLKFPCGKRQDIQIDKSKTVGYLRKLVANKYPNSRGGYVFLVTDKYDFGIDDNPIDDAKLQHGDELKVCYDKPHVICMFVKTIDMKTYTYNVMSYETSADLRQKLSLIHDKDWADSVKLIVQGGKLLVEDQTFEYQGISPSHMGLTPVTIHAVCRLGGS